MTARVRIALGGAALIGPLVAFPTLLRPKLAIALCLCVVVAFLASRSVAYPIALWGLPGIAVAVAGTNPFPKSSIELFLVGWLVLAILLTLVREENALPLRLLVSGPVLMTLGLAIVMVARLGASADPAYGSYKLQLFLAENVSYLIAGILIARSRRSTNLWAGILLATVAAGALVLLKSLITGGAQEVFPGRLALYAQADPISLARGAATGLLLAIFVLLVTRSSWQRTAALALIPLLGISFIGAGSRGPVVGLVAGLFVLFALTLGDRLSRRRLVLIGVAVLVSAILIPQLVPGQNVSRSLSVLVGGGTDVGGGDVSNGRTALWGDAWRAFGDHPFTGIGTGSFAHTNPVGIYPHNAFLEAAAELGFPGLLLFGGLVALAFVHVGRAWRRSTGEDRTQAALVGGYLAAAVVNAQFSGDFPRNTAVWLGAGLALGLVQRIVPHPHGQEPLYRLRTRWRQRGSDAPEQIVPHRLPSVPPQEPAPVQAAGGGVISSPAPGSMLRGDVVVTCRPGAAGRMVGSVVIECAAEGREWVEVGEATAEQDFELLGDAVAGAQGGSRPLIEVRPAKRVGWGVRGSRAASWDTCGFEDGEYRLRSVTTDVAGRCAVGPEIGVTVDNTPPSIHLDVPRQGAVLMGGVDVAAHARDDGSGLALVRFEFSARDGTWTEAGTAADAPFRTTWNTGVLDAGSYLLRAVALDRAGNRAVSKPIPVRVERVAPMVTLGDPGKRLSGTVGLRASVHDQARSARLEFQIAVADSFAWQTLGAVARPPFELALDTSRFEDGSYDLRVLAHDRSGGIDASRIVRRRRIDNTVPGVSVLGDRPATAEVPPKAPVEAATSPPPMEADVEATTLWQLEQLLEQRGHELEGREELEVLLYTLRSYAELDGTFPESFWPLLRASFRDLLVEAGR